MSKLKVKTECASCPTPIWALVGKKYKKTPEYSEIYVTLDNGSKMAVGVCRSHQHPDKTALSLMTIKVRQGWEEEVELGIGNAEWVADAGSRLAITGVVS